MRKIFTLIALMISICSFGAKEITGTFGSWGATCTVDGNTITFSEAWAGAGFDLIDGTGLEYKAADYSDYDYIWVTFSETTCAFKMVVQYFDGTLDEDDASKYAYVGKTGSEVSAISGSLIVGVPLDQDCSGDVAQFFLQSTTPGAMTITGIYAGTTEEFTEAQAGSKPQRSDLSLESLGSGWDSSYDAAMKTITYDTAWSGRGWWLGNAGSGANYSDFDKVVIEFGEAAVDTGQVVIEYNVTGVASTTTQFPTGATSVVCDLDATGKSDVKQIYIQCGNVARKYVLSAAYVATESYVTVIEETVVAPESEEAVSEEFFNLSSQSVTGSKKGIVLKRIKTKSGKYIVKKYINN